MPTILHVHRSLTDIKLLLKVDMEREYYLWAPGGSTVSVAFTPDVIARMREAAGSPEAAGAEIGGILLGRRYSDESITIEDFNLIPSEHRRGLTFTLSPSDRKKLSQRLRSVSRDLQPVGSFRTHLRQGLYMDQYDFDLMSTYFPAATDVMLLIRSSDWQAGLFVWEEGDIQRQKSYLEFPFDPARLPLSAATPVETPMIEGSEAPISPAPGRIPGGPMFPTLAKVGLIAATVGLVGMLAFYAREHRPSAPPANSTLAQAVPPADPSLVVTDVHAPIDPDLSAADQNLSEMHVKIPTLSDRPSPFATARSSRLETLEDEDRATPSRIRRPTQPPTPPPAPPLQTAVNLPPAIMTPIVLTPPRSPLVSVVSLEPAEPGFLSRGINRVPVLNLLQRRSYRGGDKFSPARPVRRVRPRLPAELEPDKGLPSPVDVKVWIDKSGQVTKAELLSDNTSAEVADIAANAALKWTFEPAKLSDHPVSSEMVMHFRFSPE